jgi:Tfp pilus assembly protein PilV
MKNKQQAGFSYIDVMIAVVILLVGILALVSAITGAVFQTKGQEQQLTAKQVATSTMESIMSVKETDAARLGWNKVGNVCATTPCAVPQGIFQNGVQPVKNEPGPDEVLGTADDTGTVMTGFTREIIIRDECDQDRPSYNCNPVGTLPVRVRSVEINVRYYVGAIQRTERLMTVLTNY